MFFEGLPEMERLITSLTLIEKQQQKLKQVYQQASNHAQSLEYDLTETINEQIENAKRKLYYCKTVEEEVYSEQFICEQFKVEELVYDTQDLPEWFTFVFEKEFTKQRSAFSALARKMYTQFGLHERIKELEDEIRNFQILNQRYKEIKAKSERSLLNIDREAESFQNRIQLLVSKFVSFVEAVGQKIIHFVQEHVYKSVRYADNPRNFAQPAFSFIAKEPTVSYNPSFPIQRPARQGYSIERSATSMNNWDHIKVIGSPQRRGMKRSPSAAQSSLLGQAICMNHNHRSYQQMNQTQEYQTSNYRGQNYDEHIGPTRFNYREHMPKFMTLQSYLPYY